MLFLAKSQKTPRKHRITIFSDVPMDTTIPPMQDVKNRSHSTSRKLQMRPEECERVNVLCARYNGKRLRQIRTPYRRTDPNSSAGKSGDSPNTNFWYPPHQQGWKLLRAVAVKVLNAFNALDSEKVEIYVPDAEQLYSSQGSIRRIPALDRRVRILENLP